MVGAKVTWITDKGQTGSVDLKRSKADQPSKFTADPRVSDWASFQQEVSKAAQTPYQYIFRGQTSTWRLRSAFHRTRRKDLVRYYEEDFQRVWHASIGQLGNTFDRNIPDHNGAFLHLLQHHGYPTPMLDWSYSPYIAAYFAYSSLVDKVKTMPQSNGKIRIFMFDAKQWRLDNVQILDLIHTMPHFSLLEPMAIANPRALPQQSVASLTNIDDIERYLALMQGERSKRYLKVFDLPQSEYESVLRQLNLMGISPGSLFPGMEGLCDEYRQRQFGYDP
ncbi:FRG domain-containing protein [Rhodobacteraceae bacterium CY05]|uniref:FRG domain-containing protein n=2 Tax=Parasedimentitalea huanghaiensis TaxID=2682100 RepID=A0A6L6WLM6_9RHOB|nr:FRG domain-containing protein [Zongyanglinia huanghaiensis]